MVENEQTAETRWILHSIQESVRSLREGRAKQGKFCDWFFLLLLGEAYVGNEEPWRPVLESLSRDELQLLSDYADTEFKSIDYALEPSYLGGIHKTSGEAYLNKKSKISSALRRLHEEIERRLRSGGGPEDRESDEHSTK